MRQGIEEPAVECAVLRDERRVRRLSGGRAEHVIDQVQVVVDGGHVVDGSDEAQRIAGAADAHHAPQRNANRPREVLRTYHGHQEQEQCQSRKCDAVSEPFPVGDEQWRAFDRPDTPDDPDGCDHRQWAIDRHQGVPAHEDDSDDERECQNAEVDRLVEFPGRRVVGDVCCRDQDDNCPGRDSRDEYRERTSIPRRCRECLVVWRRYADHHVIQRRRSPHSRC